MQQHPPSGGDKPLPNTVNGYVSNKLQPIAQREAKRVGYPQQKIIENLTRVAAFLRDMTATLEGMKQRRSQPSASAYVNAGASDTPAVLPQSALAFTLEWIPMSWPRIPGFFARHIKTKLLVSHFAKHSPQTRATILTLQWRCWWNGLR